MFDRGCVKFYTTCLKLLHNGLTVYTPQASGWIVFAIDCFHCTLLSTFARNEVFAIPQLSPTQYNAGIRVALITAVWNFQLPYNIVSMVKMIENTFHDFKGTCFEIFVFFSNFLRFWYQKKTHIFFLMSHRIIHRWNMSHTVKPLCKMFKQVVLSFTQPVWNIWTYQQLC